MIRILFFASFRERLKLSQEEVEMSSQMTMGDLLESLNSRGGVWSELFAADQRVMMAVNQEMTDRDEILRDGDEVAFFPPVTGG